jgi:hypothetical protein
MLLKDNLQAPFVQRLPTALQQVLYLEAIGHLWKVAWVSAVG